MNGTLSIELLAAHPELLPVLQEWFEAEWPSYYRASSPGDAQRDLQAFTNHGSLPVGVVAFREGSVCGVAALTAESIASHRHLSPWAGAGLVRPSERGKGIGAQLLAALEQEARTLGFPPHLLRYESIIHEGQGLGIYCKAL